MASIGIFQQKLVIDFSYWDGKNANVPILVCLGGEAPIEYWLDGIGIIDKAAPQFRALVVYIEHRFYGQSIPFGSLDNAFSSDEIRDCLTTEQALADFAEVIKFVKRNITKHDSPTIVIGGSYSGMLAAWFRLKYPHFAIGALASSAPIFSFEKLPIENEYCQIVARDFEEISKTCANNIFQSWNMIDYLASQPSGIDQLTKTFKSCSPINSSEELKAYLIRLYNFAAQYDGRFNTWTRYFCNKIGNRRNNDILEGISEAVSGLNSFPVCNQIAGNVSFAVDSESIQAWEFQLCSELVTPTSCSGNSMFQPQQFNMDLYVKNCRDKYHIEAHPNWISTYYGGQDIKSSLKNFGSNIIFSNGLRDPLSRAGVLSDISDTIVALTTKQGSHCLDMNLAKDDDPNWLKELRSKEIRIMSQWIKQSTSSKASIVSLNHSIKATITWLIRGRGLVWETLVRVKRGENGWTSSSALGNAPMGCKKGGVIDPFGINGRVSTREDEVISPEPETPSEKGEECYLRFVSKSAICFDPRLEKEGVEILREGVIVPDREGMGAVAEDVECSFFQRRARTGCAMWIMDDKSFV
ncbi:uncharacterized protein LOC141655072 [Silene latifolia]|uniref:uncharacterized protein LOC141655072 n=1 Tax=Silene latifolia TaxID=37657 RepID=UPI003D782274